MKLVLALVLLFAWATPIYGSCDEDKKVVEANGATLNFDGSSHVVRLTVERMRCSSCQGKITAAITELQGIESVSFDMKTKTVEVRGERQLTGRELVTAINNAGFAVEGLALK